jgi:hypothetical protein
MFDGEAFGQQMVEIVRGHVERVTAPLLERIAEVEAREIPLPDEAAVAERVLASIPPPEKGDPGEIDMEAVRDLIAAAAKSEAAEQVAALASTLPAPEKGDPGDSVDMAEVSVLIESAVKSAVAAIPLPKNGEPGNDGPGFVDALIDASGALVLTRTDGTTKELHGVKGRDGIGFAEAFDAGGDLILRMTDGSEVSIPLPKPLGDCPDDTCELVATVLRSVAEMPVTPEPEVKTEAPQPVVVNVTAGQPKAPAKPTSKFITTRRDGSGNLVAEIVERSRTSGDGDLVDEVA